MTVRKLEIDDARGWSVRDAMQSAMDSLTDDHTKCVIILQDERGKETSVVCAGVDDFQKLGLLHWAQFTTCRSKEVGE